MDKKTIVIIVVAAAAAVGGYLYWRSTRQMQPSPEAVGTGDIITQSATQGVLPALGGSTNPLENQPNVNPLDVVNPFNSVKTNPFQ